VTKKSSNLVTLMMALFIEWVSIILRNISRLQSVASVARFFVVKHTKKGEMYMYQMALNFTKMTIK
jgi:hypothetical protein